MLGAHGLSHLKSSSLSTLSAWRKNLLQSLLMHAATRRVLQSLLSPLRRKHLAAQPRTESRLQPPKQGAQRKRQTWAGEKPPRGRELGRRGNSQDWKKGPSEARRRKGVCVKWSKKWAAEVKLEERAGARQEGSGAGGAAPGPAGAPGPKRAWAARTQPTAPVRAAGALPAAPGAGVCVGRAVGGEERNREQFEGPTRQGQRAHPQPSPAT